MYPDRVPSGLDALDDTWAGLRRGAAHLLYGRARSGRDLLALRFVQGAVEAEETCVLVTARRPAELVALGSPMGLDVEGAARRGRLRLLRFPPPLAAGAAGDEALAAALADLGRLIAEAAPARLVIEDFTPFVRFGRFAALRSAVLAFLDAVQDGPVTTVLALGEPANAHSEEIVAFLRAQVAGALHIAGDPSRPDSSARVLTFLPPPGSSESQTRIDWDLRQLAPLSVEQPPPPDDASAASDQEPEGDRHSGDGLGRSPAPPPPADLVIPDAPPARDDSPRTPQEAAPESAPAADVREEEPPEKASDAEPGGDAEPSPQEAPISFFDLHDPFGPSPSPEVPVEPPPPVEDPFAHAGGGWQFDSGRIAAGEETRPAPSGPQDEDPFGAPHDADLTADSFLSGAFFLSEDDTFPDPPPTEAEPDAKPALTLQPEPGTEDAPAAGAHPAAEGEAGDPLPAWEAISAVERKAFAAAFDAALRQSADRGAPFLALGLRIPADHPGAEHFATLAAVLQEAAGPDGPFLADAARGRVALLLMGRPAEASQGVFRQLRMVLRESGDAEAEALLKAAAAVVLPQGQPFLSGEAFLTYVLDQE